MNDASLISQFSTFLIQDRHVSPSTARAYLTDLTLFSNFLTEARSASGNGRPATSPANQPVHSHSAEGLRCHEGGSETHAGDSRQHLLGVESRDIDHFLEYLRRLAYCESTAIRKLVALRSFYKFCVHRGFADCNPLSSIATPKLPSRAPVFLTAEQVHRLLETPDDSTLLGARDKALFSVLWSTGVRVGELVGLNRDDLEEDSGWLRLPNRGSRPRRVLLEPAMLDAVCTYLRLRNEVAGSAAQNGDALFLNKLGTRLSSRSVRRKFEKYMMQCGLHGSVNPSIMRHSVANYRLNLGEDIRKVQRFLGHQSIQTTRRYAV